MREAAIEADVQTGSLMVGSSVGLADKTMPIKDIISEVMMDADNELLRLYYIFDDTFTG